jgi:hypothetical protein
VPGFNHSVRVSRQEAAEHLTDVAYALVVGRQDVVHIDGEQILIPDGDELILRWETRRDDGGLRLELEATEPGSAPR